MSPAAGSSASNPKFFASSARLREWLHKHHASRTELWVGLYKKGTGRASITWPELVDQLLCFGWIDGVRKSLDAESYVNRVTPRRPRSNWSAINLKRVQELSDAGLMEPAGVAAHQGRDEARTGRYSSEQKNVSFGEALEAEFKKHKRAWSFFTAQPPSYRKVATWYVVSAKREETQRRQLERLIRDSARGERIGLLQSPKQKGK
jgi:uncharacterized protein YdeI (YjbR/CyaY-like superfamily)